MMGQGKRVRGGFVQIALTYLAFMGMSAAAFLLMQFVVAIQLLGHAAPGAPPMR